MAISQNFPSSRPSLNLNFARSKTLDPRITFTRTSAGTYVDESGIIRTASADEPRFDHNPTTGESLGLLIEEQRTNLLTYSNDFSNAVWEGFCGNKTNVTYNTTDVLSPDGTYNSTKIARNSVTTCTGGGAGEEAWGVLWVGSTIVNTTNTYTISLYVRGAVAGDTVDFGFNDSQVSTYTLTTSWQRITYTGVPNSTLRGIQIYVNGVNKNYYIWGAQLEEGAFPTSYIPTTTATVTRTADNARMTGSNFSSWFNNSEGTLYSELFFKGGVGGSEFPNIVNVTESSLIGPYYDNDTNTVKFEHYNDSENFVAIGSVALSKNTFHKNATAYKNGDFSASANGVIVGTSSSSITFATDFNRLLLGRWTDENYHLNGCIKSCTYYPTRLPNDQLQTLTK